MKPHGMASTPAAIYPPIADREGIVMDALALHIAEAHCKLLNGQHLRTSKPDLVVGRLAIGHGTAQHAICAIVAQVAVARRVLSSKTATHIQIWAADQ